MTLLDNAGIRAQFPAADAMLYLDAAHQTPLSVPVRARLDAFLDEAQLGAGPKAAWLARAEEVRAQLAGLLGVGAEQVAFTKNTSEGLNIAAHGLHWEPGDNVVVLASEHPNNAYAWLSQRPAGLEVRQVPDRGGWADAETFAPFVDERTRAIALSHVMFHSGQRNDVAGVAELAHAAGVPVVLDAMQSVGVFPVDAGALGVAALAAGSHKGLLVPHGLGFLCAADTLAPTYVGTAGVVNPRADLVAGPEPVLLRPDARRFEIGNQNLPAIHGLGGALDLITSIGLPAIAEHVLDLGDRLIEHTDRLGIDLVGPRERERRSHILVLRLPDPGWVGLLADAGVRLSPVRDGLRVSFGIYSTADDVDRLAAILQRGLGTLRARPEPVPDNGVRLRFHNGTAELTIDRPARHNALDSRALAGLADALRRIAAAPSVSGVLLRSAVPAVFCSGGSYTDPDRPDTPSPHYAAELAACFELWMAREVPVISIVDGAATAFGCALALTSDLTIATPAATFGLPELGRGVVPSMAIALMRTRYSSRLVRELVLTTEPLDADRADRRGLLTELVPDAATAERRARRILAQWARSGPAAVRNAMRTLHAIDTAPDHAAVGAIARAGVLDQLERFRGGLVDQAYLEAAAETAGQK